MIVLKRKLWGTLSALTFIGILFATSSPLFGAPVPGGPGFVSIGSAEFRSALPSTTYYLPGNRLVNLSGVTGTFFAPVHLPQGATITQFVLYFIDNGTSDIVVFLSSVPLDDPTVANTVAVITTSGASPAPRTLVVNTAPNGNIIDNQSNFYVVTITLPSSGLDYQVGGVRIDYKFPINLPLIMK